MNERSLGVLISGDVRRTPTRSRRRCLALALVAAVISTSAAPAGPSAAAGSAASPVDVGMGVLEAWGGRSPGIPPHAFDGTKPIAKVTAFGRHAAVLAADGSLEVWGDLNPTYSNFMSGVRDVDAGPDHFLVVGATGQVGGWGDRVWMTNDSRTYTAVAAGAGFSVALDTQGKLLAWGDNDQGQTTVPAEVKNATVTAISAGDRHTLALTSTGTVHAWGAPVPAVQVPADLTGVTAIDAGPGYSVAIADGHVRVWGDTGPIADVPSALTGQRVVQVAAGEGHVTALTVDGKVYDWGDHINATRDVPAAVSTRTSGTIAAGDGWSVALTRQIMARTRPTITLPVGGARVGRAVWVNASDSNYAPAGAAISGYQWQRNGVDILGATKGTYQLTGADWHTNVRAVVTVTKPGYGTDTFPTGTTYVETGTFERTGTPFIHWADSEPLPDPFPWDDEWGRLHSYPMAVGGVIAFNYAEITPRPEKLLFRWMVSDTDTPEGWRTVKVMDPYNDPDPWPEGDFYDRAPFYTPKAADYGRRIKMKVEATSTGMEPMVYDTAYFPTWVSTPNPSNVGLTFSSTANVGETIRPVLPAPYDFADATDPLQGWWFADDVLIHKAPALGDSLTLTPDLLGKHLRYELRWPDKYYKMWVKYSDLGVVDQPLIKVTQPVKIQGRALPNTTLTASTPVTTPKGTIDYQWLRDGDPIVGASNATYRTRTTDVTHHVSVRATVSLVGHLPAVSESNELLIQPLNSPIPGPETS